MKNSLILMLALAATTPLALATAAGSPPDHPLAGATAQDQAAYPLKTCVVSGEELGGMGKPVDYYYEQAGQPPRLVRFCCRMCVPKFKKDPAKYLKRLDEAAAAQSKP